MKRCTIALTVIGLLWLATPVLLPAAANSQDIDALIAKLKSNDPGKRAEAADALAKMGPEAKAAVPALLEALKDANPLVRSAAAFALGDIHADATSVVPALIRALEDPDEFVRHAAASGLSWFGPEARSAVPALLKALEESSGLVKSAAAAALGMIGPEAQPAASKLIALIGDSDKFVRSAAALAIGNVAAKADEAVPALVKVVNDDYIQVRKSVVLSLGRFPTKASQEALKQVAAADPDESVRKMALQALANMPKILDQQPVPDPKVKSPPKDGPAGQAMKFTNFKDPMENAFIAQVPAGWKAQGGTTRPYLMFTTFDIGAISPDGQILIYLRKNDATKVIPTPELDSIGLKEGGVCPITGSGNVPIRRYAPGAEFLKVWVLPARKLQGLKELHVKDWPNLAKALVQLPGFEQIDVGEIHYAFQRDGKPFRGGAFAVTRLFAAPGAAPSLWHCDTLAFYEAPEGKEQEARQALVRLMATWRINPVWYDAMSASMQKGLAAMREASAYTSQIITSTFWQKWATEDRIFRKDSQATLGTLQVMDPRTGEEYTVDNLHTFYFITRDGKRYGSEDSTPRKPLEDSPLVIIEGQ